MSALPWAAAALAVMLSAALALWHRRRFGRAMQRLERALDAAMEGRPVEERFDEARLSALESRLLRHLAAGRLSAQKLQRQRDQISSLISDVAHQTRTPVSNLQLYAQLLQEQPLPPQARGCAREIAAQAQKLQMMIESLVKASRLEGGMIALHPRRCAVAPMVRRALMQYAPKAEAKGLALRSGALDGEAAFDPRWTEEALCNLLDNAVKYTPSGGEVRVEAHAFEQFCEICVRDSGPGVPEGERAKIFGRFYRGQGAREAEGVGVGLYLSRQILERQGGYLKLESAPGAGSAFSLFLPTEQ